EDGNYVEVAYGITTPKVGSAALPTGTVAKSFNTVKLGFKTNITKNIAVALTYNNNPAGADISYLPLVPIAGAVNGQILTLLGKYQFNEKISAFAGAKYQYLNGSISVPGAAIIASGKGEYGYIVGAAYEIPEIKLRVALSFESAIDYSLTSTFNGAPAPTTTTAGTPDTWLLEFQSGVARNTLVFGSIRYAKWTDAQITLPVLGTITAFEDVTTYELGVAYKFNEKVVGFASIGYEAPDNVPQSAFAPTDGQFDMSFGGQFKVGNGYKISTGMTYSRRGDTTLSSGVPGLPFNDISVMTFGVKVSKNF
ncbi:MAG: hypothetical protein JKX71_07555, partial [Amylibacter sp.]|nr:hypothetical protein [Amylibacter sp.]